MDIISLIHNNIEAEYGATNMFKYPFVRLRSIFVGMLLTVAALLQANVAHGEVSSPQGVVVAGIVTDASGEPLPGVNVVTEGGTRGVITDANGKYSITVSNSDAVLVFSFVGYVTQEAIVGDQATVNISLPEDARRLEEVVVIGYGTQKRKELTGAVVSVSKAVLAHPAVSLDGMLGGAVAGVHVTQVSGQPGAGTSIRIRGGNSVTANNDPLYVIDGFIFYNDLSSVKAGLGGIESSLNPLAAINPADIESVEILKDVSATAIYGSRGANGVILVTTKKGVRGAANVSYQYGTGWSKPAKRLDLLNANQWARMQKDFFLNKGKYTDEQIEQLGEGYDWQDAVLQTGVSQTHELSVSGGTDQLRYLLSGNYTNRNGIVLNSGFERFNARLNLETNVTERFTAGVTATAGKSVQNSLTTFEEVNYNSSPYSAGIANSLTYALYMPPVVPVYDGDDYNYNNPFEYDYLRQGNRTANPVSDLNNSTGQTIHISLLGNAFARYKLIDGLTAKVSAGTLISHATQNFFAPSYTALGLEKEGIGGIGDKRQEVLQTEYTLTYARQLNKAHFIDLLAGYTWQDTKTNYVVHLTSQFTDETLGVNNLADGAKPFPPISGAAESKLHSLLGRVNYSLVGRYHLTATIRGDKSTRFAKKHRWGFFPSVGVSWNINEEAFLKSVEALNDLKLRFTGGTVGNQEIGDYEYAQTFVASSYNGGTTYRPNNLGNKGLKWETTVSYNAGVDAGLFGNRLSIVADAYYKKTSDLLLEIPVDPSLGVNTQLFNVGNVTNKGVEFSVNLTPVENKNLKWTVSVNFARNINTITSMGERNNIILGRSEEEILQTGESLGSFYGLAFAGIVQKDEDVTALPSTAHGVARAGDLKMADVNGADGTPDNWVNYNDRTVLGSTQPDFTFGATSTLDYRNFDLFVLLQGSRGNKIYNHLRRYLESPNDSYNGSTALLDSWTENHPSNSMPGLQNMADDRYYGYLDSRYVEDASFLRLKNLTLGYTVKTGTLPRLSAPVKIRIFASAENLFAVTPYKGYDPEVARGIDLGTYPTARTFSIGAKVNF
ncbi:MAG: TonB-dependent receptor [Bacteroidales bacterium]|nr:TonB-dependent receptor [Bacteroidales bacterium]